MPYNLSAFQTVPSALVSTFGDSDLTVAYFLLVPESFKLNHRVTWEFPENKLTLIQNNSINEIWAGGSIAKRLGENWSIGGTLFLIQQSKSGTSTVITTTTSRANTASSVNGYETSTVYVGSLALGVWNQYAEWGQVGLRLQTPALHLSGNGSGYISSIKTEEGVVTEDVQQDDRLRTRYQIPFDLTLGNSVTLFDRWHLYADVSVQFAMAYERVEGSALFPNSTERVKTNLRYHLGTKWELSDGFSLLAGGYVIPSAADSMLSGGMSFAPTTYYGTTGGFQFRSGRIKTGLGAFFTWANTSLEAVANPSATSQLNRRIYGALITIGYYL